MEIQVAPLNIKRNCPATEEVKAQNKAELARYRKELGEKIVAKAILTPDAPTTFTSSFDGYGDSFHYYPKAGDEEVDALLSHVAYTVMTKVNFDWHSKYVEIGSIMWDSVSGIISIDGYHRNRPRRFYV